MDAISTIIDTLSVGRDSKNDGGRKVKAILVFSEIPNSCDECEVTCTGYTAKEYTQKGIKRPSWCPLRPLPHKLQADWYTDGYKEGFNACLDAITGGTE